VRLRDVNFVDNFVGCSEVRRASCHLKATKLLSALVLGTEVPSLVRVKNVSLQ
jgi:hypothetical protein